MIKYFSKIKLLQKKENPQYVITFTGGMGAQIISAGIYFYLKKLNKNVYADLSYFEKPVAIAKVGETGVCSHWGWQLDIFNLKPDAFITNKNYKINEVNYIEDGPAKSALAFMALKEAEVQKLFSVSDNISAIVPELNSKYVCFHIRRGDYVNVASHLVPDDYFIEIGRKISNVINSAAIISDTPIDNKLKNQFEILFNKTVFLDNIDASASHLVMRNANILVCSNSQFSITAGLLNHSALIIIPKKWFGSKEKDIEKIIHEQSNFMAL